MHDNGTLYFIGEEEYSYRDIWSCSKSKEDSSFCKDTIVTEESTIITDGVIEGEVMNLRAWLENELKQDEKLLCRGNKHKPIIGMDEIVHNEIGYKDLYGRNSHT